MQLIMPDCYVSTINCFFDLNTYLSENTVSVVETNNGDLLKLVVFVQNVCYFCLTECLDKFCQTPKILILGTIVRWESPSYMRTDENNEANALIFNKRMTFMSS
jgi:hypothetical protein